MVVEVGASSALQESLVPEKRAPPEPQRRMLMPHPNSQPSPTISPSHRPRKPRRPFGDPIAAHKEHPDFVQAPPIHRVNLNLPLRAVMPEDWIKNAGHIAFHTVGDTGGINGTEAQEAIA